MLCIRKQILSIYVHVIGNFIQIFYYFQPYPGFQVLSQILFQFHIKTIQASDFPLLAKKIEPCGNNCKWFSQSFIFIQSEDSTNPTYFFNIYNALEPGTEFDLDKLARM